MATSRAELPPRRALVRFEAFSFQLSKAVRWNYVSAAVVLIGCAVATIPFAPSYPADGLDSAWVFALNAAVGHRLAFGRDVIFTFGPYASLYTFSYNPATDRLAMWGGLLLAIALGAGVLALMHDRARWRGVLLVALVGLAPLRDSLFLALPLVVIAVAGRFVTARNDAKAGLAITCVLLIVCLALLTLIKATFAAAAWVCLALALVLLGSAQRRYALAAAAVFVMSLAAFWCGAHQHLADLPHFFVAESEIVGGYTEAMAWPGPLWQVAVFAAAAAGLLVANLRAARRAGLPGLAVWLGAAVLLFLSFKAGFVRQDLHIMMGAAELGLIACILALVNPGWPALIGLAIGLAGWVALEPGPSGLAPARAVAQLGRLYGAAASGALDRLKGDDVLRSRYEGALANIRSAHTLPALSGTTDIYSDDQSIVLAYGLPWSPRPVLQSYSAFSVFLETENARHLEGPDAPENVLVELTPIDNHLPALEDGLSWLPLLTRYEATSLQGDMAVLHRLPGAGGPSPLTSFGPRVMHRLGENIPLPSGPLPVWAQVDVEPTLLGRALALVFRTPQLGITIHLANGQETTFRYVSGMGRAGFVVSPLVEDTAGLLAMRLPGIDLFGNRVASFSIWGNRKYWRRFYTVRLARLQLPASPGLRALLLKTPIPAQPGGDPQATCYLDKVNGRTVDHHFSMLNVSGPVEMSGWGFGGVSAGVQPTAAGISLTADDGSVETAPASVTERPDVGIYFRQPNLQQIGFQAFLDLGNLAGTFRVALEMQTPTHRWSCPLYESFHIAPQAGRP